MHSFLYKNSELLFFSQVWKVSWNVFGSVLYSCGDDGRIRMWKGTINGPWKCESSVSLQPEGLERAKAGVNQSNETAVSIIKQRTSYLKEK